MTIDPRLRMAVLGTLALAAATAATILLAPRDSESGAFFGAAAAVLAHNVLLARLGMKPLVPTALTIRQTRHVAIAWGLLGVSMLYAQLLPTPVVVLMGLAGMALMAWSLLFARGDQGVRSEAATASTTSDRGER